MSRNDHFSDAESAGGMCFKLYDITLGNTYNSDLLHLGASTSTYNSASHGNQPSTNEPDPYYLTPPEYNLGVEDLRPPLKNGTVHTYITHSGHRCR